MQLTNTFTVPVPVDTAWTTLLDVERVAPCMPGASLDSVDGDDITGSVAVKLGPIMMRYHGTMTFTHRDDQSHRVVLTAKAKEVRGGGFVSATVTASLVAAADTTEVNVTTDLEVTGKAAQFGRNVLADVSHHIVSQFAANLAKEIQTVAAPSTSDTPAVAAPAAAPVVAPAESSLNGLSLLAAPARRLLPPVLTGVLVGLVIGRVTKR